MRSSRSGWLFNNDLQFYLNIRKLLVDSPQMLTLHQLHKVKEFIYVLHYIDLFDREDIKQ